MWPLCHLPVQPCPCTPGTSRERPGGQSRATRGIQHRREGTGLPSEERPGGPRQTPAPGSCRAQEEAWPGEEVAQVPAVTCAAPGVPLPAPRFDVISGRASPGPPPRHPRPVLLTPNLAKGRGAAGSAGSTRQRPFKAMAAWLGHTHTCVHGRAPLLAHEHVHTCRGTHTPMVTMGVAHGDPDSPAHGLSAGFRGNWGSSGASGCCRVGVGGLGCELCMGPAPKHGMAWHGTAWHSAAQAGARRRCLWHSRRQAGTRDAASRRATRLTSPRLRPADAGDKAGGSLAVGRGRAEPHSLPSTGVQALRTPRTPSCTLLGAPSPGSAPTPALPWRCRGAGPTLARLLSSQSSQYGAIQQRQRRAFGVVPAGGEHGCHPRVRVPARRALCDGAGAAHGRVFAGGAGGCTR